jgi:uncharacterized protein (TIGR03067 family)
MHSKLEGAWQMIRAELAGEKAPELVATRTEVVLAAGTYQVRFDGRVVDRGSYELGAAVDLHTMILRGAAGPNAGRTIPCIYQIVGDRLRICYGVDGRAPADFTTSETQPRYLATYRRKPA